MAKNRKGKAFNTNDTKDTLRFVIPAKAGIQTALQSFPGFLRAPE